MEWVLGAALVYGAYRLVRSLRRRPNWLIGECYCGDVECGGGCRPEDRS